MCFTQNLACISDCAWRQATENSEEVNIQKSSEEKRKRKQTEGEKYAHS